MIHESLPGTARDPGSASSSDADVRRVGRRGGRARWLRASATRSRTARRSRPASRRPSARLRPGGAGGSGCATRCARLNPGAPAEALEDAFRELTRPEGADPGQRNRAFHRLLVDGVTVEYRAPDGAIRRRAGAGDRLRPRRRPTTGWRSTSSPSSRTSTRRRPDVVLFVNGLPLAVIELKNAADENATIWTRLPAAPDLQGRDPVALRLQRGARRLRRRRGARRHAHRRPRVVQALADDRGRGARRPPRCPSCRC